MRRERSGDRVGLPDVHLSAGYCEHTSPADARTKALPACTKFSDACVGVVVRRLPTLSVRLAIDVLQVASALSVAVSFAALLASYYVH